MRILFYDTETSGMPDFAAPSSAEHQPHIVQIAACLVDEGTREILAGVSLTVKPDGWKIGTDVIGIHGITNQRARETGVPESTAVRAVHDLWQAADLRVAHKESFDCRIMRIALKRQHNGNEIPDAWKAGKAECTAQLARPLMKLPKAKTPTLAEAYRHFMGQELQNAHTAHGDVIGCIKVYWAIKGHPHG